MITNVLFIPAIVISSVVNPLLVSPTIVIPEDYIKTTVWSPDIKHKTAHIQPGDTEPFPGNHSCKDDASVVPATGSLPTTGSGAPSLNWTDWFVSLFDTFTLNHKKNYGSTVLNFNYDFISCQGYQKFLGTSTGNVYKRNGVQWDYVGVFDAE